MQKYRMCSLQKKRENHAERSDDKAEQTARRQAGRAKGLTQKQGQQLDPARGLIKEANEGKRRPAEALKGGKRREV